MKIQSPFRKIGVLLLVIVGPKGAFAVRGLSLDPIVFDTVHGGVMGTTTCASADMLASNQYPTTAAAVSYGANIVQVNVNNPSSIPQQVRIIASVRGQTWHSNGAFGIANTVGPAIASSAPYTRPWRTLNAGDMLTLQLSLFCSSTSCMLRDESEGVAPVFLDGDSTFSTTAGSCSGVPQVCIAMHSIWSIRIEAKDSSGSDTGHIKASTLTRIHRCNGFVDKPHGLFATHPVLGGQAF